MSASQKFGIANPATETNCSTRSAHPPRTAATTPKIRLMTAVTMIATTTIDRVTGKRFAIIWVTDSFENHDAPKSPRVAGRSQARYCTRSG